ncbi:MAG: hypothetical protein J5725_09665 [Bacteroidales bacterium]|nr:hypothetical protein [Bacteroidales bacterium]
MKKLLLAITLIVGVSVAAIAQPRAIGGRLGWNLEFSYQHGFGKNFLEIDAGTYALWHGIHAAVVFDWVFASPNWTPKGTWDWYAGVGGAGGFHWYEGEGSHDYQYAYAGVAGQIGLSYTFWFPLQLSIDYRPTIGVRFAGHEDGVHFHDQGFFDFALGVRYAFGAGK